MDHEDRGAAQDGAASQAEVGPHEVPTDATGREETAGGPVAPEPLAPPQEPADELPVPVPTEVVPPGPVVASGTTGEAARTPVGRRRRGLAVLGYVAAAILGAAVIAVAFVASGAATFGPSPSPAPTFSATGATVGVPGSPVAIEIWADYQCPYCGLFAHGIEPTLFRDYAATGRATVTFRDFAFLGQESIDAAVAARCAGRQGKFWTYHDLLYASQNGENQGAFGRATLDALADFAGLDKTAFDTCLGDATVAKAVADEKIAGDGFGVTSTPTIRITGPGGTKLLKGVAQPSAIAAAVDAVATAAPSGSAPSGGSPAASASTGPTPAAPSPTASSGAAPSPAASSPGASSSGG